MLLQHKETLKVSTIEECEASLIDLEKYAEKIGYQDIAGERANILTVIDRLKLPSSLDTPKSNIDKKSIDIADEKALDKAATDRMTSGQNTFAGIIIIAGILFLFIAWPVGVALFLYAGFYLSGKTEKYKNQIIAEGKAQRNSSQSQDM
jgi:hypothetical protein